LERTECASPWPPDLALLTTFATFEQVFGGFGGFDPLWVIRRIIILQVWIPHIRQESGILAGLGRVWQVWGF